MLLATEGLHSTITSNGQKKPQQCLSSSKQDQVNPWMDMGQESLDSASAKSTQRHHKGRFKQQFIWSPSRQIPVSIT